MNIEKNDSYFSSMRMCFCISLLNRIRKTNYIQIECNDTDMMILLEILNRAITYNLFVHLILIKEFGREH